MSRRSNLYAVLEKGFPADRSGTAIETVEGRSLSYRDLDEGSARIARFLGRRGSQAGDRILVQVEKSPEAILLYLGCIRAGFIYVPLNTAYSVREMEYFLADSKPALAVCRPEARDTVARLGAGTGMREVYTLDRAGGGTLMDEAAKQDASFIPAACSQDDVAAILYTSGTTGRPKGAMLTHGNLASNGLTLKEGWGFSKDDILLHALPIFHVHGLFVACHCVLLSGAMMIFMPKFDARLVVNHLPRCTVFMGVPTYYTRLLAEQDFVEESCRRMRLFISGSAPLQDRTFHAFKARTGQVILERYGMTETGMNTSNPLKGERKPGTVGPPLPRTELRIVDEDGRAVPAGQAGNIQVKGPNVFRGYWQMPEKSAEEFTDDGWFRTGDLGRQDDAGYVSIVGRSKDLIITGGYNVYPKEIETVIDEMDGVQESAVIGVPDPDFGERVVAVVVREPGRTDISGEGIVARVRHSAANYKVPKEVLFRDELPRNAMGKVQKNALRDDYRQGAG